MVSLLAKKKIKIKFMPFADFCDINTWSISSYQSKSINTEFGTRCSLPYHDIINPTYKTMHINSLKNVMQAGYKFRAFYTCLRFYNSIMIHRTQESSYDYILLQQKEKNQDQPKEEVHKVKSGRDANMKPLVIFSLWSLRQHYFLPTTLYK